MDVQSDILEIQASVFLNPFEEVKGVWTLDSPFKSRQSAKMRASIEILRKLNQ
jgi:hypothetical protein